MLTVHSIRGAISNLAKGVCAAALALSTLIAVAHAAEPKQPTAELTTFAGEQGQSYYALSVTPPVSAQPAQPHDVVILFDTSASQTGPFRDTALAALDACLAKLGPQDRVQLFAADLEARPMTKGFVAAGSPELKAAVEALRKVPPLGSTDMENIVRTAASKFDNARPEGRAVLYIGKGRSSANLIDAESFRTLVGELSSAHIPLSSYAIGPQIDGRLLASLANQTGGVLYVAEAMASANEAEKVTETRAKEENIRRGSAVGTMMADWAHATVYWPTNVTWPAELGQVYPKNLTPLRTDRDSVAIGVAAAALNKPLKIKAKFVADGKPVDLHWTATVKNGGDAFAYLPQVVHAAQADDGLTLPTVGSAGLAEMGRIVEAGIDSLTDVAERAVETGDMQGAQVAAKLALARDPGNIKAKTVQQVIEKQQVPAKAAAQTTNAAASGPAAAPRAAVIPPQPPAPAAAPAAGNDLSLVRQPAVLPPQPAAAADQDLPAPVQAPPAPGSLTDQFSGSGALLDQVEQNRRVYGQMMRREIENTVNDARKVMGDDPQTAIQNLKLALQNVERAPNSRPMFGLNLSTRCRSRCARRSMPPRSKTSATRNVKSSSLRPASGTCSTTAWRATARRKSSSSIGLIR